MVLALASLVLAGAPDVSGPVYAQLNARDGVECSALGLATPDLKSQLFALTDPAILPAAVPIRAAGCLISLFPAEPDVETAVTAWMSDPERQGFGLVALSRLDAFPEPAALRIVTAARLSAIARVAASAETVRATSIYPSVRAAP